MHRFIRPPDRHVGTVMSFHSFLPDNSSQRPDWHMKVVMTIKIVMTMVDGIDLVEDCQEDVPMTSSTGVNVD